VHLEPRRHDFDLRDRVLAAALAEPLVRDVHEIAIYKHAGRASVSLHVKLDPDVPLAEAHEVAERAVRADPGVDDVYTDRTGRPPRELRLLHTDDGLVVFVSVVAARDIGLPHAHELASRLEDDIR
jgi:divalent metal cation (Fe/Co/Zn/Cd) transporter